jgi:hypothetical protein
MTGNDRDLVRWMRSGACLMALLLVMAGCGDDADGGGTQAPTNPPAATNTQARTNTPRPTSTQPPTATGRVASATPTPTETPAASFAGTYSSTVALDDQQEAHLNLTVDESNQATGTLEVVETSASLLQTRAAVVAQGISISAGLVSLSGSVNPGSGSFHFAGNIMAPGRTIPFDISGTLPGSPSGSGGLTLTVDGRTYTSTIARGAGPTPLPTQPGPTPTPADGCVGGGGQVTFSNVSGANTNQPLDSLDLAEAQGNISSVGGFLFTIGGSGANCPIPPFGVVRLIRFALSQSTSFVAGSTYQLGPLVVGQPIATFEYSEATAGPTLQNWKAESGTMTIESIEGDRVQVRFNNAAMVPGAPFLFGPPPLGTFTINATLTIDPVTRISS